MSNRLRNPEAEPQICADLAGWLYVALIFDVYFAEPLVVSLEALDFGNLSLA